MEKYINLVRAEIVKVLSIEESCIFDDSALVDNPGVDSLDIIDLTYSLAPKLNITMPTTSLYQHAVDNLTEQELAQLFDDSTLTPLAKELFSSSCYKYTAQQLQNIETPGDIYSKTSIFNWASLCKAVAESESKNAVQLLTRDIKSFVQKINPAIQYKHILTMTHLH